MGSERCAQVEVLRTSEFIIKNEKKQSRMKNKKKNARIRKYGNGGHRLHAYHKGSSFSEWTADQIIHAV